MTNYSKGVKNNSTDELTKVTQGKVEKSSYNNIYATKESEEPLELTEADINELDYMHDYFLKIGETIQFLEGEISHFKSLETESEKSTYSNRNFESNLLHLKNELVQVEGFALGFRAETSDDYDASGLENASDGFKIAYVLNKMAPDVSEYNTDIGSYKRALLSIFSDKTFITRLEALNVDISKCLRTKRGHICSIVNREPDGGNKQQSKDTDI
jgi:hypothetical protein